MKISMMHTCIKEDQIDLEGKAGTCRLILVGVLLILTTLSIAGHVGAGSVSLTASWPISWEKRYDSCDPANGGPSLGCGNGNDELWSLGDDRAWAVATDSQDNVIVTGMFDNGVDNDYLTIQYDGNGNLIWAQRYDGCPVTGCGIEDQAYGVATDSQDNIIVTGASNNGGNFDYLTIKYDPTSRPWKPLWYASYSGTSEGIDMAHAVAVYYDEVDDIEYVIVTGKSWNPTGTDFDYVTIKYDNSNGKEIWVRVYDSCDPANGGPGLGCGNRYPNKWGRGDDGAYGVAADSHGNIIVTGTSNPRSDHNNDWYTIKYDASGTKLYDADLDDSDLDNAQAVVTDSQDYIIVTGRTFHFNHDCLTIKYDSTLSEFGRSLYDRQDDLGGPSHHEDQGRGVVIDSQDNIIVTGWSWVPGDLYDYFTIAYDADLNKIAPVEIYHGGYGQDQAEGVAIDSQDNIIVTGASWNQYNSDFDYYTIVYHL